MNHQLAKAIDIASQSFLVKTDNGGQPYILHCLRVMNNVDQNDSELMQIAVLHDVLEDTDIKVTDLTKRGFSARVIDALKLLTHNKADSYMDYIKKISFNKDAVKVKMADLRDNSNITRLKGLRKKDFERMEKYNIAYTYLSGL